MLNKIVVAFILTLFFAENDSFLLKPGYEHNASRVDYRAVNNGPVPEYYDWRDQGMVSPVKNQLTCNACWAFCVVANIESHLKIYLNVEETLSEQFLIDCDEDKKGCGSASIIKTFADIVTKFGGILRETDYYPYASKILPCRWQGRNKELKLGVQGRNKEFKVGAQVTNPKPPSPVPVVGFRRVLPNEEVMAQFVYQYGPLSAAINSASMARYRGGIDEPSDIDCSPQNLDHSILIVGYNTYVSQQTGKKVPYWIIKNSWGVEWGDKGFYYLVRGRNACGIASDASFAYVN